MDRKDSTNRCAQRRVVFHTTFLFALGCIVLVTCDAGAARRPSERVVILGMDGLDPRLVKQWMDAGKLPNMSQLAGHGCFSPLQTTIPPESPVAWATFETGVNPGAHGVFDFLNRDPKTYAPQMATV